jgi:hypothetical protein
MKKIFVSLCTSWEPLKNFASFLEDLRPFFLILSHANDYRF